MSYALSPCNTVKPRLMATTVIQQYGHFIIWPLFWLPGKMAIHFLVKKPSLIQSSINLANLFWPISDHINGVPLYFQINQQSNHFFFLINQQTYIIFSKKKTLPVIYVRSRSKPSFWYLLLFCDIYEPQQKKQTISFHFNLNIIFTYFYMKFPTSHQELQFLLYFYKLHPTARSHFQMRQGECQDTFPCLINTMNRLVR